MRWIVWGAVAIAVFEVITILIAKAMGIDPEESPFVLLGVAGETAIFMLFAFWATRESGRLRDGVLTGAALGSVGALTGLAVSTAVGLPIVGGQDPIGLLTIVLGVAAVGAFFGFLASLIARRVARGRAPGA